MISISDLKKKKFKKGAKLTRFILYQTAYIYEQFFFFFGVNKRFITKTKTLQ